jgi:hypothetical protein
MIRDNTGMVQAGRRQRLTPKPLATLLILTQRLEWELQRFFAVKPDILGEMEFTHTSRNDLFNDFMVRNRHACSQRNE